MIEVPLLKVEKIIIKSYKYDINTITVSNVWNKLCPTSIKKDLVTKKKSDLCV